MRESRFVDLGFITAIAYVWLIGLTDGLLTTPCTPSTACFPWSASGPACGRGANINLRFQLELDPANYINVTGQTEPVSNVTYAFCPRVDELQAFNITEVGTLAYTSAASNGTVVAMSGNRTTASLWVIGFGNLDNVIYPRPDSGARVVVADTMSTNNQGLLNCNAGEVAVVTFLVLNITLNNGMFQYFSGYPYPAGTAFAPTCDSSNACLFDSTNICVGEAGSTWQNCGQCMTPEEASVATLQVWASYYGTDAAGRDLTSGASNPLNFQAYSASGVVATMRTSFQQASSGQQVGSGSLSP